MSRNNFLFSFISIMSLWLTQSQLEQNKGILFNGILIIVTVFGALFFSIIIIFLISIEGLASLLHRLLNPFPLTRLNEKLSQKVREMSLCFCLPWFCLLPDELCLHSVELCLHPVEFCLHSVKFYFYPEKSSAFVWFKRTEKEQLYWVTQLLYTTSELSSSIGLSIGQW